MRTALDDFTDAYIRAMFWMACDDAPDTEPDQRQALRYGAGMRNLTRASLAAIIADCEAFRTAAGKLLDGADQRQAGHDFWLTRERHGAGFWDRLPGTYPNDPDGSKLNKLAHTFGDVTGAGYLYQVGRWVHYTARPHRAA